MNSIGRRILAAPMFLFAVALSPGAFAQGVMDDGLRTDERLRQLEQELSGLRTALGLPSDVSAEESGIEQAGFTSSTETGVVNWSGPPRRTYPTVHWSGFLQLDSGWIGQDDENVVAVGNVDAQVGLRRVRLRAFGDVRPDTRYVVDLDFAASGHPSFRDVFLEFRSVPLVQNAAFGYYKQPFGMDAETSGQELLLLERQPPFAFAPFRQTGFGFNGTHGDGTLTFATSVYTFPTNSFGVGSGDGLAASTRITALPYIDEASGRLIHLGVGYGIGDPSDSMVRYAIEPGFFVTDPATTDGGAVPVFVDTGDIPARLYQLFNLEFAAAAGPFRWQSETRFAFVDQIGGPGLGFSGAYFQLGLLLTGEQPDYDKRRAIFHRVVPDEPFGFGTGGCGAWELAAGCSVIDLNDRNIAGGKMFVTNLGLNCYLSEFTRFMLNLSPVLLDDPAVGRSRAFLIGTRFQASF